MTIDGEFRPDKAPINIELQQAVEMTAWFPDYLFGFQDNPNVLPSLTSARLKRQFGVSNSENLRMLCDEIATFPGDIQPDVAAYICGFPDKNLDAMLLQDVESIIELLDSRFPPPVVLLRKKQIDAQATSQIDGIIESTNASEPQILQWQSDAMCAQTDPEAFFPEKGGSTRKAKIVCLGCEAIQQCLVYALQNQEDFGIWGGHSERERRELIKHKQFNKDIDYELIAEDAIKAVRAKQDAVIHKKLAKKQKAKTAREERLALK
jgi:hypothetical protein